MVTRARSSFSGKNTHFSLMLGCAASNLPVKVCMVFMSGLFTVAMVSSTGPALAAGAAGAAGAAAGCTRGGAQATITLAAASVVKNNLRREIVFFDICLLPLSVNRLG